MTSLRVPLYPAEEQEPPCTVCVIGCTSYIGGAIIARLLAAGHTVRGTCREPGLETPHGRQYNVRHLYDFPGANERLTLYRANLVKPEDFDEPLQGCKYLIHVASPVDMNPPKGKEHEKLIGPAVKGVGNVLGAASRSSTLEKVVMTSSVAAVMGDNFERGPGHVFTEEDWTLTATDTYLTYHRSKLLAEKKAYEIASTANWELATILPSIVQGPPSGPNIKCESVGFMRKLLNGGHWPFLARIGAAFVDVDDVAAAHTLAMVIPEAKGRFLVSGRSSMTMLDYVDLLRPEFSAYKLPFLNMPFWLIWLFVNFGGGSKLYDINVIRATYGKVFALDTTKARMVLGMTFTDIHRTAQDMAASLIKFKLVKREQGLPASVTSKL